MSTLLLLVLMSRFYTRAVPVGEAPSPRIDGTIAYDADAGDLYAFGGQDQQSRNDLWVYSMAKTSWNCVETGARQPAARFGHAVVVKRRRLVMFGGQGRGFYNDVWAFDVATRQGGYEARGTIGLARRGATSPLWPCDCAGRHQRSDVDVAWIHGRGPL